MLRRLIYFIWDRLIFNKPEDIIRLVSYDSISNTHYYVTVSFRSNTQIPIIMVIIEDVQFNTRFARAIWSWM